MGQHASAVEQYLSGRTGTPIEMATLRSLATRLDYIETTGEAAGLLHSLIPVYLQVADRMVLTIDDPIAQLRELHSLFQSDVLSESEFNMKKWDVLSSK